MKETITVHAGDYEQALHEGMKFYRRSLAREGQAITRVSVEQDIEAKWTTRRNKLVTEFKVTFELHRYGVPA